MNAKLKLGLSLVFGGLVTLGGWYLFLVTLDILPYPQFSIPMTIIIMAGFVGMIAGQLGYGPLILYEAWKDYKEEVP